MPCYSKEILKDTISCWQSNSDELLTEDDANEIINNMTNLVCLLIELENKYDKEEEI